MSNMSYCRFQNTLADMYDCFEFNGYDVEENEEDSFDEPFEYDEEDEV